LSNPVLDRLRAECDRAFEKQQAAYQTMKTAGEERSRVKNELDRNWENVSSLRSRTDRAYESQQAEWDSYKSRRDAISREIDAARARADSLHSQMSAAFDRASDAFNYGDKAAAPSYAAEGRAYKSQLEAANNEVKRLINEVKSMPRPSGDFQYYKNQYDNAKCAHDSVKLRYRAVKQAHESAKSAFEAAKAAHARAKEAFQKTLADVKATREKRSLDDQRLMERAGIPIGYRSDCKVVKESDGTVNFYFGGLGGKDGSYHGHIAMDFMGNITYYRNPFEDHGKQHFTDYKERWYKLKMSFDYDSSTFQSDNYFGTVGEKNQKAKGHIAVDDVGNIVFVRDEDGVVLYDKKNNIGYLPSDLNWNR